MQRHLGGLAAATALMLSLYACSLAEPGVDGQDGGPVPPGGDGSSGGDGPNDRDARVDGQLDQDGAIDAAVDGDAAIDAQVDAGPPVVRFIGRFDTTPAAGPKVAWPGASIVARFSGSTEVKATFDDALLFSDYGANRWEVLIDGAPLQIIQLTRAQTTYSLASGLSMAPHTVELVKLTEGSVGTSQFLGFDFVGGTLLPPPIRLKRRMQFLGDSSSNGYGVDGAAGCSFSAATQNERKSYPALIAHDLFAENHNLSASGKGIVLNNYRPDTEVFSILYKRTGVYTGNSVLWNAADYTPDVVWVTLGGNDYSDPDGNNNNAPDMPGPGVFAAKYDELVGTIRTQHPNAYIFASVAPSLTNAFPTGYNAYTNVKMNVMSVVNARAGAPGNDAKIFFFEFTRSNFAVDLTACDGHINIAKHRAMADEAITLIKSKTGW